MTSPQENILSRRTIYRFLEKKVPEIIVMQALKAASCAPCHKHTHPWRFYSIGKSTRESLIPLITKLARIKSEKRDLAMSKRMSKGLFQKYKTLRSFRNYIKTKS